MWKHSILVLIILPTSVIKSQKTLEEMFKVDYDTPLTIDLEEAEKEDEVTPLIFSKKKPNKKIFYGIKTRRGFTKTGFRQGQVVELFHTLKSFEEPPKYMRDFYWYDKRKRKLVNSLKTDPANALILHGHYEKKKGDVVLEEGYFYKGLKHGRWMKFNTRDILIDKKIYFRGWPEESKIRFYDEGKLRIKEVIPVHYGEMDGTYYAFHENGNVAVVGRYKYNHRIKLWREFYDNKNTKREVSYPTKPFDFDTKPVIVKEWDKTGKLIYDRKRYLSLVKKTP